MSRTVAHIRATVLLKFRIYVRSIQLSWNDIRWPVVILVAVFVYTLSLDLFIRLVFLPHILPQLHAGNGFMIGGDSIMFHEKAVIIATKIREHGWSNWTLKPGLEATVGVASAIYAVLGDSPLWLLPLNSLVHALSALVLFQIMRTLGVNERLATLAIIPFVFFPTAVYWHSQLHKDGFFILGMYCFIYGWLILFQMKPFTSKHIAMTILSLASGVGLVWVFREYAITLMLGISVGMLLMWILFNVPQFRFLNLSKTDIKLRLGIMLGLIIFLYADSGRGQAEQHSFFNVNLAEKNGEQIKENGEQIKLALSEACPLKWNATVGAPLFVDKLAFNMIRARIGYYNSAYTTAGSTIDREYCIQDLGEFVAYLPRALQVGLFAPFPRQWIESSASTGRGAMRRLAGAEMVVTYVFMVGTLEVFWQRRRCPAVWALGFFSIFAILTYAVITPNVGALHRMRYGFLMIIVAVGVIGLVPHVMRCLNLLRNLRHFSAST